MELGLITQYTQVNDAPDIKLTGTSWYPKNSGGGNYGVVTIRRGAAALAQHRVGADPRQAHAARVV